MDNNSFEEMIAEEEKEAEISSFARKLYFFDAFKDFILIYARNNIGSRIEVNTKAIAEYISSFDYKIKINAENMTRNEIFEKLEEDLINGMPIWNFLKLTDWQVKFLSEELKETIIEKNKELEEKYICFRDCKYFKNMGAFDKCKYPYTFKDENETGINIRILASVPKEECNFYKKEK